jgi:hypothetical protein
MGMLPESVVLGNLRVLESVISGSGFWNVRGAVEAFSPF